jgi:hypothetical protein
MIGTRAGEYATDSDTAIVILGVDKNGEEQSSSQGKGELHGHREGSILTQAKSETEHEELLRVGTASASDVCVSTNDLLNWTHDDRIGTCSLPLMVFCSLSVAPRSKGQKWRACSNVEFLDFSADQRRLVIRSRECLNAPLVIFDFPFEIFASRLSACTR